MTSSDEQQAGSSARRRTKEERAEQRKKKMGPSIKYPFWFGGSASSMAACVTHPLDLGKVFFFGAVTQVC